MTSVIEITLREQLFRHVLHYIMRRAQRFDIESSIVVIALVKVRSTTTYDLRGLIGRTSNTTSTSATAADAAADFHRCN